VIAKAISLRNGREARNVPELLSAIKDAPVGERVKVTYLRMDESGHFLRQTTIVTGGPLGSGVVPI
jgi:hypothetical protein